MYYFGSVQAFRKSGKIFFNMLSVYPHARIMTLYVFGFFGNNFANLENKGSTRFFDTMPITL